MATEAAATDDRERHISAFLRGEPRDPALVLEWRRQLRAEGEPARARALSRTLAERFISGVAMSTADVDLLWKACKADEAFSQARRVLRRRRKGADQNQDLRDQAALITSKDPDLAASVRHDWALNILQADLASSSAETLGIAGGIWKRRWEWDGKVSSLEQSLRHYLAPVDRGQPAAPAPPVDRDGLGVTAKEGYPAINAAFVCDLLAHATGDGATRRAYRDRADALRTRIRDHIHGTSYWDRATRAEALFGLGDIDGATALLKVAAVAAPDPWERETTARQLARLGTIRGISLDATRQVVAALVGDGPRGDACVQSVLVGKVGLALSGGGFRASLYHLGVLARLAESDLLRHVQMLSCVSGGSMLGAAYYLRLRNLLQTKPAPDRDDYVALVEALITDFREGTNFNLRSSLFTDLEACHAVLSGDDSVYAARMTSAVFQSLYSRILTSDPQMAELSIEPAGTSGFHPKYHNLDRAAKVPALFLNATSLNTGHSWQFTASTMGESPFAIASGADPLPRLRRSYYRNQRSEIVRPVTLSQAVAASACVPGLFAPLSFPELFDGYDIRLVDGGVYDNQGALALLQEDCNVLLVSDACGQLGLNLAPGGGHVAPLTRSFDIFQERMRLGSFDRLTTLQDHGRITALTYVHLKKDLDADPVNWRNCEDPMQPDDQLPATSAANASTSYGVWKKHQERMASIRTDLDVFSDVEAAALMASGYLAINAELPALIGRVPALQATHTPRDWFFSPIIPALGGEHRTLARHLEAGATQFLRIMKLDNEVRKIVYVAGAVLAAIVGFVLWLTWDREISVGWFVLAGAGVLASYLAPIVLGKWSWSAQLADPIGAARSWAFKWIAALGTWTAARWLVPRLTRRYLDAGRIEKVLAPGSN